MDFQPLYEFWFGTGSLTDPEYVNKRMGFWFAKDEKVDAEMRTKFAPLLDQPELVEKWKKDPRGLLTAVILYDQVPRNSFRGTPTAFEYDSRALNLAKFAYFSEIAAKISPVEEMFLLLPFEHSEVLADQQEGYARFKELVMRTPGNLRKTMEFAMDYSHKHLVIIERFGRFPHRNAVLGRTSTAEEVQFLKEPGSSF